ncbi:hypothetical protein AACK17_00395 [Pectobacterium punjabense]|nr:hypothetical protein [Pectobacterium punjabense]
MKTWKKHRLQLSRVDISSPRKIFPDMPLIK